MTQSYNSNDLIVSQDRFTVYRATKFPELYQKSLKNNEELTEEEKILLNSSFSTGDPNLHLDLSPWWWEEDSPGIINGIEKLNYEDIQDFIKENNLVVKSFGR